MGKREPSVHIQDQQFKTRALCGKPWTKKTVGGRAAGDAPPPIVVSEKGSVRPANCETCIGLYRKRMGLPAPGKPVE